MCDEWNDKCRATHTLDASGIDRRPRLATHGDRCLWQRRGTLRCWACHLRTCVDDVVDATRAPDENADSPPATDWYYPREQTQRGRVMRQGRAAWGLSRLSGCLFSTEQRRWGRMNCVFTHDVFSRWLRVFGIELGTFVCGENADLNPDLLYITPFYGSADVA